MYCLQDIEYETRNFWVLNVGTKGYEVMQSGITHSTRVASVGRGGNYGLPYAIAECDRRQAAFDAGCDRQQARK